MALFTPEELAELRLIDEEIDEDFCQTQEEIVESRKRDRAAKLDSMDIRKRKVAEYQKAYYEANRDKVAEYQKAYYEANRDKVAGEQRDILISFRRLHGYSQAAFARLLGITQPLVSQWENRRVPANLDTVGAVFPELAEELKGCENA